MPDIVDSLSIEISARSDKASSAIDKLVKKLEALQKGMSALSTSAKNTKDIFDGLTDGANDAARDVDRTNTTIVNTTKTTQKATSGMSKFTGALALVSAVAGGSIISFKGVTSALKNITELTEQYATSVNSVNFSKILSDEMPKGLQRLSGLSFNENTNLLESTGKISFGVSIKDISHYNATLTNFAKTLGLTKEASNNVSDSFLKLAGDISTLTGENYKDVSEKLQDALTGSADALKKYGIALSDNILQQTAHKYGIEKSVSAMTSAEKAQISFLTVMQKTESLMGSQVASVNSLSSMFAQWKANISDINVLLGQAFSPIVKSVLPYLNAFAILIKDILSSFARLMGIEEIENPIKNIKTSLDGVGDSFNTATSAAKKLKSVTLGIDELNINAGEESAGSAAGVGGASFDLSSEIQRTAQEYNKAVEEAFNNAKSKVESILEKIRDANKLVKDGFENSFVADVSGAVEGFKKIEQIWSNISSDTRFQDSVEQLKESLLTAFGSSIGSQSSVLWSQISGGIRGIADALEEKAEFITDKVVSINDSFSKFADNIKKTSTAISEIGKAFESESFSNAFSSLTQFATVLSLMSLETFAGFLTDLSGLFSSPIIENADKLKTTFELFIEIFENLSEPLKDFADIWAGSGIKYEDTPMHKLMVELTEFSTVDFGKTIDDINKMLEVLVKVTDKNTWKDLSKNVGDELDKITTFFNDNLIIPIKNFTSDLYNTVYGHFNDLWVGVTEVWSVASNWFEDEVILPITSLYEGFKTRISKIFEGLWIIAKAIWVVSSAWFNDNVITPVTNLFSDLYNKVSNLFSTLWNGVKTVWSVAFGWFNNNVITPLVNKFTPAISSIKNGFLEAWESIKNVWGIAKNWFKNTILDPITSSFEKSCDFIGGTFDKLWGGIKKGVSTAMNVLISSIENTLNFVIKGINSVLGGFNSLVGTASKITGQNWTGVPLIPSVNLGRIPAFIKGGFPDEYSLFMAGEHGHTELLGTVGGRTAVAGGAEITGIRDEVYNASRREVELLQEQNALLRMILEKDLSVNIGDRDIARANARGSRALGYALIT